MYLCDVAIPGNFFSTLLPLAAQDDDIVGYDTMVVKEDDNESLVSYSWST